MKTYTEENAESFCHCLAFDNSVSLKALTCRVENYFYLSLYCEIQYHFLQNEAHICSDSDWQQLSLELKDSIETSDPSESFQLKIECLKPQDKTFLIFSPKEFLESVPKVHQNLIKYWTKVIEKFDTIILDTNKNKIEVNISKNTEHNYTHMLNNVDLDLLATASPESTYNLASEFKNELLLYNHLLVATSIYCLRLMCSQYQSKEKPSYTFEGYTTYTMAPPAKDSLENCAEILYTIYQWIFSDNQATSKLGILQNIVSMSNSQKLEEIFSHQLLKSLFSNYKVYLQDNIKQYFDVKNKVTEFIFNLSNKAIDTWDQYKVNSRNAALAIFSYFFSVVIVRSIGKNNLNIFSPEVTATTIVFIIAAVAYLIAIRKDLIRKNSNIQIRLKELRHQYSQILCEEELDEMLKSESLNKTLNDSSSAKYHYVVILLLLSVLLISLYFGILNKFGIEKVSGAFNTAFSFISNFF